MVGPEKQPQLAGRDSPGSAAVTSAVPGDALRIIVDAARRAPSGDNCQPWHFHWDGNVLRVQFLPDRAESFYDVGHCASWIALGAILTNVTVAARHCGVQVTVEPFPQGESETTVARIRLGGTIVAGDPLFPSIAARCVNRRPYGSEPLPPKVRDELVALAPPGHGVRLRWIEAKPAMAGLAMLAAENDRVLYEHRELHDGLYRWIRWSRAEAEFRGDGMPIATLELDPLVRVGFRLLGSWRLAWLLSAVGGSRMMPGRARSMYRRSAAIGLLTVAGPLPADWVRAGEVFERIWLTATLREVAVQPITGITFLLLRLAVGAGEGLGSDHRRRFARLADALRAQLGLAPDELPAMMFRVGIAPPPSARSPRLSLDTVLTMTSH